MTKAPVYLDYNATTPVVPQAIAAANDAMAHVGNPSSVHAAGRRARAVLEDARRNIAEFAGVESSQVVFTSGGTEANAMVILGSAAAGLINRVIVLAIEHDSVLASAKLAAERYGIAFDIAPVLPSGVIDLEALERMLKSSSVPGLVSIMAANNETGVLQPIDEAAKLAHAHGALFHTDAAQACGRVPFGAGDFDFTTIVAHKLGGMAGAAALIIRGDRDPAPLWGGGKQESARRSGTESLTAIAAFGAAAAEAKQRLELNADLASWRDAMEERLKAAVPGIKVFGAGSPRLPQTSCIGLPSTLAETQVIALDLAGFQVSAGSACSSGKVQQSHVLTAMGMSEAEARCAIRVSFGWNTKDADLHQFTDVWTQQLMRSAGIRAPLAVAGAA